VVAHGHGSYQTTAGPSLPWDLLEPVWMKVQPQKSRIHSISLHGKSFWDDDEVITMMMVVIRDS
jgi:hypothetical protein